VTPQLSQSVLRSRESATRAPSMLACRGEPSVSAGRDTIPLCYKSNTCCSRCASTTVGVWASSAVAAVGRTPIAVLAQQLRSLCGLGIRCASGQGAAIVGWISAG
jgi:hypothetical protein